MILGLTSMAVTQARNRHSAFNILAVPNLVRLMLYKSPYPSSDGFSNTPHALEGETVGWVDDRTGNARWDQQQFATLRPVMHLADGLEFDTVDDYLVLNNGNVANPMSAFTAYLWGTQVDNNGGWIPLAHLSGNSYIIVAGNIVNYQSDGGVSGNGGTVAGGKVLLRLTYDGTTLRWQNTGDPAGQSAGISADTFTFNEVGAGAVVEPNQDPDNRHRGQIIIAREITLDSAEDFNIRNWIKDNDPGYDILQMPPVNTSLPTIDNNTPTVGDTINGTNGLWTNSPTSYSYQWKRDGVNIAAATSNSYTTVSADMGHVLTFAVVATNTGGDSAPAVSGATSLIIGPPVNTGSPVMTSSGDLSAPSISNGDVLSVTTGAWNAYPAGTIAIQWTKGTDIGGATNSTYTPVAFDLTQSIGCRITYTNSIGSTSATSNISGAVGP